MQLSAVVTSEILLSFTAQCSNTVGWVSGGHLACTSIGELWETRLNLESFLENPKVVVAAAAAAEGSYRCNTLKYNDVPS